MMTGYLLHGNDKQIIELLAQIKNWPGGVLKSHNDTSHLIHKLAFLADIGLDTGVPEIAEAVRKITENLSPEGLFQVQVNIPQHFGGTGQDQWSWMLCDAPLLLYSLKKLGGVPDKRIKDAVEFLAGLAIENGWPCSVSPDLGKFRGPGRKSDPCPYATLLMLKLLSLFDEYKGSSQAHAGAEVLLSLWEQRKERRPYMFAMGSGFEKLKAPLIWYDILHVTDVLSRFDWLRNDLRLKQMVGIVKDKADENGLFTPESVYKAWAEWDFGQKKKPSSWLTFVACSMIKRFS